MRDSKIHQFIDKLRLLRLHTCKLTYYETIAEVILNNSTLFLIILSNIKCVLS